MSTSRYLQDGHPLLTHASNGLAYIHEKGFTHRDPKPENILVKLDSNRLTMAKIADFGTSKNSISR